jgi:cytoskeletal protein RodZ
MITFLSWLKAAYTWCKGHLMLVGFAVMGLCGFLFGFESRKRQVVAPPAPDPVVTKAVEQTAVEDAQAQAKTDEQIQVAEDTEVTEQKAIVTEESTETTKVEADVDQTNAYLKEVSNEVAGAPPGTTAVEAPVTQPSGPTGATGGTS